MLPPSPAVYVAHLYPRRDAVLVRCDEVHRYRDYACTTLVIHKHGHDCERVHVHWTGTNWRVQRERGIACPHPLLVESHGSLLALKI